ncbi:hypothetical protein V2J09_021374 [Rumex salicifolius]
MILYTLADSAIVAVDATGFEDAVPPEEWRMVWIHFIFHGSCSIGLSSAKLTPVCQMWIQYLNSSSLLSYIMSATNPTGLMSPRSHII